MGSVQHPPVEAESGKPIPTETEEAAAIISGAAAPTSLTKERSEEQEHQAELRMSPESQVLEDAEIAPTGPNESTTRVYTIALDDSDKSRDAFSWMATHYYRPGDTVVLLHASQLDFVVAPGVFIPLGEEEERHARKMLRKYARYCMLHNMDFDVQHLAGTPGEVLEEAVSSSSSAALIIGNHNKGLATRVLEGSVSEYALHNLPVPVILIKRSHEITEHPPTPPRKIAIAVNQSEAAKRAFAWAAEQLYREGDTLIILHVDQGVVDKEGAQVVANYSEKCREASIAFQAMHIHSSLSAGPALARMVETIDPFLLVLGCRGRGMIARTLFGSVSDHVVRHCSCDIAVVK